MSHRRLVVTGTDTDIGKTVLAAALTDALGAHYWKPVQAGLDAQGHGDAQTVARLAGLGPERIVPGAYYLKTPCSPHRAAEIDGVTINPDRLHLPEPDAPLVIEGAGGVLTPLTRSLTYADMFARWGIPAVLVARTSLGTINHSLMSLEALRSRAVPVLGIAFIGEANADTERTIVEMGPVRRLGRLPRLDPLDRPTLAEAFRAHFDVADFGA